MYSPGNRWCFSCGKNVQLKYFTMKTEGVQKKCNKCIRREKK